MSKSQEVTESCVRRLLGSCQHMVTDSASSPGAHPSPQEQESNVMAVCKLYCQMAHTPARSESDNNSSLDNSVKNGGTRSNAYNLILIYSIKSS